MKVALVIPARLASTRLPRKLLLSETGKPLIQHTYEAALRSRRADCVLVAADHEEIFRTVHAFGGQAVLTSPACASGTDRVAEVARARPEFDLWVNVQGDEPEIPGWYIDLLIELAMWASEAGVGARHGWPSMLDCPMATLAAPLRSHEALLDPACVKVVFAPWRPAGGLGLAAAQEQAGHVHAGYVHAGYVQTGHVQTEYLHASHVHDSQLQAGHAEPGHVQGGHAEARHVQGGHIEAGHAHAGHPHAGYAQPEQQQAREEHTRQDPTRPFQAKQLQSEQLQSEQLQSEQVRSGQFRSGHVWSEQVQPEGLKSKQEQSTQQAPWEERPGQEEPGPDRPAHAQASWAGQGAEQVPIVGRALYFSRSPIPHAREWRADLLSAEPPIFYQHLGCYAYRREFLLKLAELPPSRLESVERLEQLRVLEAGYGIAVAVVPQPTCGIDTPADYRAFVERQRGR